MINRLRIFAPPEFPVLSLEVQAHLPVVEAQEQRQFRLLVRHCLERFFNNDMVSADGETKERLLQVAYAIALPGVVVALYLAPLYHAPLERPFWSQVSDHYFFVLYSFVAVGAVTIFSWDLLFPDLLDLFVLSPLPIAGARLFRSRMIAAVLFLGLFLFGSSAPGIIFYPMFSDPPGLARHVLAHVLSVLAGGAFAAALILSLQGLTAAVMGERFSRAISPFLQGVAIMLLMTIFLLFPVTSRFLEVLMNLPAARYFPPFWFLGIYETVLAGSSSQAVFSGLAKTGCMVTAVVFALTIISYPLAYRRRMRYLVEGAEVFDTRNIAIVPIRRLLHLTLLRNAVQRGIYHFISCSLLRTQRHRVYMALYGGLGLALLLSCTMLLKLSHRHLGFALSPDGLRAAVPIAAFWTIAGLRTAFLSPTDRRGGWIFRVILGRPTSVQLGTTVRWILPCVLGLTLGLVALIHRVAPPELRGWNSLACQVLVAVSLCLLLTDALFLKVRTIPFTGETRAPATNLAFILLQYFGLFPPLVLLSVGLEPWLAVSVWHVAGTVVVLFAVHLALLRIHNKDAEYHANLIDLDEDEEEFPQRLGLRY
ncbi:MAG: hypothetical protein WCD57_21920 [Acidobacteriaceae bacterium]